MNKLTIPLNGYVVLNGTRELSFNPGDTLEVKTRELSPELIEFFDKHAIANTVSGNKVFYTKTLDEVEYEYNEWKKLRGFT